MRREPGERESEIIVETDDGTQIQYVKEWEEYTSNYGSRERTWVRANRKIEIDPPDRAPVEIESEYRRDTRWRRRVIEQLADRVDTFKVTDEPNTVPVNVINKGKPAVTSYLYAIHGWDYKELNEALDLTGGTVRQYVMAVANNNR
jgi:hypothetical protein